MPTLEGLTLNIKIQRPAERGYLYPFDDNDIHTRYDN